MAKEFAHLKNKNGPLHGHFRIFCHALNHLTSNTFFTRAGGLSALAARSFHKLPQRPAANRAGFFVGLTNRIAALTAASQKVRRKQAVLRNTQCGVGTDGVFWAGACCTGAVLAGTVSRIEAAGLCERATIRLSAKQTTKKATAR